MPRDPESELRRRLRALDDAAPLSRLQAEKGLRSMGPGRGSRTGGLFVAAAFVLAATLLVRAWPSGNLPAGAGSTAIVTPSSQVAAGCGVSARVLVGSANSTPITGARGPSVESPVSGLAVAPTDSRAAFVHPIDPVEGPNGLPLVASILSPWTSDGATPDTRLILIYGSVKPDGLSYRQIINAGDWIVSETPPRGQDSSQVLRALQGIGKPDHGAEVQVGAYSAALVLQDAVGALTQSPFGLYWSDGTRDVEVNAIAPSETVINYARSLYCNT